jgi:hypothetical protein
MSEERIREQLIVPDPQRLQHVIVRWKPLCEITGSWDLPWIGSRR